jgi:hypothetical protein
MGNFRVLDVLDKTIVSEESFTAVASRSPACWPSEASAELLDQSAHAIVGSCHRKSYYRMIGTAAGHGSLDAIGAWRFIIGRQVETHVTELCKVSKPAIWAANGVKLFVGEIGLSLEMDLIVKDPKTNQGCIVECKTFYGAAAKKQYIGAWGKPKLEHVMQICMYLLEAENGAKLKDLIKSSIQAREVLDNSGKEHRNRCEADLSMVEAIDDGSVSGKLVYLSRDDGDRVEFDVSIEQDSKDGFHYPYVNGLAVNAFTIESIYERYRTLQNYWYVARNEAVNRLSEKGIQPPQKLNLILSPQDLQKQEPVPIMSSWEEQEVKEYLGALEAQVRSLPDSFLPPAEYEWSYRAPRIEQLYKIGEIGKTKYNDWKVTQTGKPTLNKDGSKSKRKAKIVPHIGDWQCRYCSYKNICIPKQRPDLAYQVYDLQNIAETTDETEVEFDE